MWQRDVTDIHLPQRHWWYAVRVIDYYSQHWQADVPLVRGVASQTNGSYISAFGCDLERRKSQFEECRELAFEVDV